MILRGLHALDERTAASLYLQMLVHQRSPRKHGADFDWASWQTSLSLRSAAPCVAGVPETQCHQGRDSGQRGRAIQVEDGARLKIDLI